MTERLRNRLLSRNRGVPVRWLLGLGVGWRVGLVPYIHIPQTQDPTLSHVNGALVLGLQAYFQCSSTFLFRRICAIQRVRLTFSIGPLMMMVGNEHDCD